MPLPRPGQFRTFLGLVHRKIGSRPICRPCPKPRLGRKCRSTQRGSRSARSCQAFLTFLRCVSVSHLPISPGVFSSRATTFPSAARSLPADRSNLHMSTFRIVIISGIFSADLSRIFCSRKFWEIAGWIGPASPGASWLRRRPCLPAPPPVPSTLLCTYFWILPRAIA